MSEAVTRFRKEAIERALHGPGKATGDARRAAFDNTGVAESARTLVDKIAKTAWKITDDDIAAVKRAGLSEDEIFELAVNASYGQATRQLESAFAALDEATSRDEVTPPAAKKQVGP